jgi:hypothetical protein
MINGLCNHWSGPSFVKTHSGQLCPSSVFKGQSLRFLASLLAARSANSFCLAVRGIVDVEILENLFEAVDIFDD